MSLLQELSYAEYKNASAFNKEQCDMVAKVANFKLTYNDSKSPGEQLLKFLDRRGFSAKKYRQLLTIAANSKTTYYRPQSKVAILIANEKYEELSRLVTPSVDCEALAENLKKLGFVIVLIKNTFSDDLKTVLSTVLSKIPENSYCFIFYAGHGCELCNTRCILSIDCPTQDIEIDHCVTENWILREVSTCKPELCILIMDMCRMFLDRCYLHYNQEKPNLFPLQYIKQVNLEQPLQSIKAQKLKTHRLNTNLPIFAAVPFIEDYTIHRNLLIGYSAESSQAAYEVLQIECSTSIDNCATYELKPGDSGRIVPLASQYVTALCARMMDNIDVSTLLDKVHEDVENSMKKQRPIKVQCGASKRSLYDTAKGDMHEIFHKLKDATEMFRICCTIEPSA